jgi:hypothetical protein
MQRSRDASRAARRDPNATRRRPARGLTAAAIVAACWLVAACHRGEARPGGGDELKSEPRSATADGVSLTPGQIAKMGLVTRPAQPIRHVEETTGFGLVMGHDAIAQAAAELASAEATARFSRSALERVRKLDGTAGAVSADVEETAAEKAAVDAAALRLTRERLSGAFGMNPPWNTGAGTVTLAELASGRIKLLRATFALGELSGGTPASLRAARIAASDATGASGWTSHVIWNAAADAAIPGRSFFAILKGDDIGEGERLRVWVPVGKAETGVVIPSAAAVLRDGKYWCYVEKAPGTFVRTEIDVSRPTADGYFVSDGVVAGDKVVETAVGQLLAQESAGAAEPD